MTVLRVRKKPVEVQAMLYTGTNDADVFGWVNERRQHLVEAHPLGGGLIIPTLEGSMKANPGDYIIRGVKGEFYPCKPDVFAKSYDIVGNLEVPHGPKT